MEELTSQIMDKLSADNISQISQVIGLDTEKTKSALSSAMPLMVSALAKNTSKPDGAESLYNALAKDHDGSILKDMPGFLGNPQAANGAGILGHIFGNQQSTVTQGLAQTTGINSNQTGQLLEIAAPLLLGALGQQQQDQAFDTSTLAEFLGGQQQIAQQSNPDMMSMLNNLLDRDKDGSAVNDIMGMIGKLFGRR